jgi:hypothetical protein
MAGWRAHLAIRAAASSRAAPENWLRSGRRIAPGVVGKAQLIEQQIAYARCHPRSCLTMPQTDLQNLNWVQGWGVVRLVDKGLELVAFFDTQDDAEAAAEATIGCQVCWLTYRDGLGVRSKKTANTDPSS